MTSESIKILDCTLREAGYLNNWQFSDEEVRDYINIIKNYNVSIAEIGFRYAKKDDSTGICAYCPDEFINSLQIPDDLQVSVMIKAEQFENTREVKKLFTEKKNSRIDMVRVAAPAEKIEKYADITGIFMEKGYKTSLNITKIKNKNTLNSIEFQNIDILYIADTYGEFNPFDIRVFADIIKQKGYSGPIGFHAHNTGLALKNSLAAIEEGFSYIDSTINGIGKGLGNLKTEDIAEESKNGTKRLHFLQNCKQGA